MDAKSLGKWAWVIALVVSVLLGLLKGVGVNLALPGIVSGLIALLAVVGGFLHLSGTKDLTGWLIIALALRAFSTVVLPEIPMLGEIVSGVVEGAGGAVSAATTGALLKLVIDWVMGAFK
ncbi:MAG: hypothetical protein KIS80_05355 [Anaerolineales bacterium]|nr:hypothetical protein [Anaerolineales bacterium]